ncbi:TetR/AcrR family transcriptional regulator [Nocardia sp. NPDC101769]|uniref:TetR/AcrR family transcriptional regulator n=1 Tax=Nocardia sp. NPDC101769 TaxID=3364333 RepID=UPI0037F3DFBE
MAKRVGRRELNKQATRQALLDAAKSLFAQRGYAATTVREIADEAGVTERTFFRYFAGKEELLVEDLLAQMPMIVEAIERRPYDEPPLVAVERAMVELIGRFQDQRRPNALLLFLDRRPVTGLGRSTTTLTVRFEEAMSTAIRNRLARRDPVPPDLNFRAAVHGRTAVAVMRTALIHDLYLRNAATDPRPSLTELIGQAFAMAPQGWGVSAARVVNEPQ